MTPSKPGNPSQGKPAEQEQAELEAQEAKQAAATEASAEDASEAKPKRRLRRPAKKATAGTAAEVSGVGKEVVEATKAEPEAEAEAEVEAEVEVESDPAKGVSTKKDKPAAEATEEEAKPKPRRTRRRAQADAPAQPAPKRKRAARDYGDNPPMVRAHAKYVRTSARKARLVCDHIRGKSVDEARAILAHANRDVARDWSKLLESAVANAEHNHELLGDDLRIHSVKADEGPTLKRFRPRAMGRATQIRKRTSHLSITLTPKDGEY